MPAKRLADARHGMSGRDGVEGADGCAKVDQGPTPSSRLRLRQPGGVGDCPVPRLVIGQHATRAALDQLRREAEIKALRDGGRRGDQDQRPRSLALEQRA